MKKVLKISYVGTFNALEGVRYFWMGAIYVGDECLSDKIQMYDSKLTHADAVADAQRVAGLLDMECQIPNDPCL